MTVNDDPKTFLLTNYPCGICGGSCATCGSNYCLEHRIFHDTCLFCRAGLPVEAGRTPEMIHSLEVLATSVGVSMFEAVCDFAELWKSLAAKFPEREPS